MKSVHYALIGFQLTATDASVDNQHEKVCTWSELPLCTLSPAGVCVCARSVTHRMILPMMRKREKATPMPRPMSMPRRTVAPKVTNQTIYVCMYVQYRMNVCASADVWMYDKEYR